MSPELVRIISDCMCRSDGLDVQRGMLVYDDDGKPVPAREWYDTCARILGEVLAKNGYRIERVAK